MQPSTKLLIIQSEELLVYNNEGRVSVRFGDRSQSRFGCWEGRTCPDWTGPSRLAIEIGYAEAQTRWAIPCLWQLNPGLRFCLLDFGLWARWPRLPIATRGEEFSSLVRHHHNSYNCSCSALKSASFSINPVSNNWQQVLKVAISWSDMTVLRLVLQVDMNVSDLFLTRHVFLQAWISSRAVATIDIVDRLSHAIWCVDW